MAEETDLYERWLEIPSEYCPPNHYVLLGVEEFLDDESAIDAAAKKRTSYLHQLAGGPDRKAIQTLLGEVAVARRTLLNSESKAEYDEWLRTPDEDDTDGAAASAPISLGIQVADEDRSASRSKSSGRPQRKHSRRETANSKADTPDRSKGGRRKKSMWDVYKIHLASASILSLGVLIFWLSNRNGGRQAAAVRPQTQQPPAFSGAGFAKQTPQALGSKKQLTEREKKVLETQGLGGSFRNPLDDLKETDTQTPTDKPKVQAKEPNKNNLSATRPQASNASPIKLAPAWANKLTTASIFNDKFADVFDTSGADQKLYQIRDNKIWPQTAVGKQSRSAFVHKKFRFSQGRSLAIDTNVKANTNQAARVGLEIANYGVVVGASKTGVAIYVRNGKVYAKVKELVTSADVINVVLHRDENNAKLARWLVKAGDQSVCGRIAFPPGSKNARGRLIVVSPSQDMTHKVWASNFKIGKLKLNWPK